ncbi:MAG: acyl carrier protein [Acidimicrobiales bacterium]|nr:acyl carrier protein [Acidimicrobiales bacterium]
MSDASSAKGELTRADVLKTIQVQLGEILEIDPDTVLEGASFTDDLGADSLALIELVEALEDAFGETVPGFRIDDEDLEDLLTVRDSVDYIATKLGAA